MGPRQVYRRVSEAFDYTLPVAGGLASMLYALIPGADRLVRWLRTNDDYEPEIIG